MVAVKPGLAFQLLSGCAVFIYSLDNVPGPAEYKYAALLLYSVLLFPPLLLKRRAVSSAAGLLPILFISIIGSHYRFVFLLLPQAAAAFADSARIHPAAAIIPSAVLLPFLDGRLKIYCVTVAAGVYLLQTAAHRHDRKIISRDERILGLEADIDRGQRRMESLEAGMQNAGALSALEERNRISSELHDHLGHVITGSIMQLQAAELLLRTDPDGCGRHLKKTSETLSRGMDRIRAILRSQSPLDEELGIRRIKKDLNDFSASSGFDCVLETSGAVDTVPSRIWMLIQSAMKEALTNVRKYSGGDSFRIRIEVLNRIIRVEFRDNGAVPGKVIYGMGLKAMEEKTMSLGGSLIVDTEDGFSVVQLIPRTDGGGEGT